MLQATSNRWKESTPVNTDETHDTTDEAPASASPDANKPGGGGRRDFVLAPQPGVPSDADVDALVAAIRAYAAQAAQAKAAPPAKPAAQPTEATPRKPAKGKPGDAENASRKPGQ